MFHESRGNGLHRRFLLALVEGRPLVDEILHEDLYFSHIHVVPYLERVTLATVPRSDKLRSPRKMPLGDPKLILRRTSWFWCWTLLKGGARPCSKVSLRARRRVSRRRII